MIVWSQPYFFYFLIIWILLIIVSYIFKFKTSKTGFSNLDTFKKIKPSLRVRLLFLPTFLKYAALFFVIISLARPQLEKVDKNRWTKGLEIILALDISESMNIPDLQPTRLQAAKKILNDFIQWRKSDKMGLLVFSGASYMHVPLTLDHKLLLGQLEKVKTLKYIKQGTAIGVALASAIDKLRLRKLKSKIIILITDGENNTGEISPLLALQLAKKYNIKIYTVGIGRQGRSKIPISRKNIFGQTVTRYQFIDSKVNEKLLKQIAKETKANFYLAESNKTLLNVFKNISLLETSKIKNNQYFEYKEKFYDYLIWAIILYCIALLLEWGGLRIYS